MFTAPEITSLRFTEDDAETQSLIATTTKALLSSRRAKPQLRVVLASRSLSEKTIAALISALRKLREVGGAIQLRAENRAVQDIILRHGLERIFEFAPVSKAPAAGRQARGAVARAFSRAIADFGIFIHYSRRPEREEMWMVW